MTEPEKMKFYHQMQTIKEMPECLHEITLVTLCNIDQSGRMERLARILADYGMNVKKIVPCIMAIMQDMLVDIDCDGKSLYSEQERVANEDG